MKRSRTLTALAFLAVAAVAAGAGAAHRTPASVAPASASFPVAAPVAAREAARGLVSTRRAPGDFRRHAVEGRLVMKTGGGALVESAPPTLMLKGSWLETVASVDGAGATLVVAFTPREVAPPTLSQSDLARPFSVVLDPQGRVTSVTFARGVSGDARQALRALVAEMQLTRAAAPSARAWRAEEDDTTGRYEAAYQVESPTEVRRTKEGYDLVVSSGGFAAPLEGERYDVESVTRYQVDGAGGLVALGLRESLHVATGQGLPPIDALQVLSVKLTEAGRGPVPEAVEGVPEQLASLTARSGSDESHDLQMAHGADYTAVRARLAEIERMDPKAMRLAVTHALPQARAVLRLDRIVAFDAAKAVADRTTPPVTATVLATALATAGTDEARGAIVDLARSDDAAVRLTAARAMTQLQNPDEETSDTLRSLLSDEDKEVAGAAGLALGASVRQGGGASGSDANAAAVAALIQKYDAAADDATRVNLVYALGNAGGREVLPVMIDALGRGADLAPAATYGLRFVPGADVDAMLGSLLSRGALLTRISAVQSVLTRDRAGWAPKLAAMLQGQLPDALRQAIASSLGAGSGG